MSSKTLGHPKFTVLGPSESPWGDTPLFGKMLARDVSLGHPKLAKTFEIAELLTRDPCRSCGIALSPRQIH